MKRLYDPSTPRAVRAPHALSLGLLLACAPDPAPEGDTTETDTTETESTETESTETDTTETDTTETDTTEPMPHEPSCPTAMEVANPGYQSAIQPVLPGGMLPRPDGFVALWAARDEDDQRLLQSREYSTLTDTWAGAELIGIDEEASDNTWRSTADGAPLVVSKVKGSGTLRARALELDAMAWSSPSPITESLASTFAVAVAAGGVVVASDVVYFGSGDPMTWEPVGTLGRPPEDLQEVSAFPRGDGGASVLFTREQGDDITLHLMHLSADGEVSSVALVQTPVGSRAFLGNGAAGAGGDLAIAYYLFFPGQSQTRVEVRSLDPETLALGEAQVMTEPAEIARAPKVQFVDHDLWLFNTLPSDVSLAKLQIRRLPAGSDVWEEPATLDDTDDQLYGSTVTLTELPGGSGELLASWVEGPLPDGGVRSFYSRYEAASSVWSPREPFAPTEPDRDHNALVGFWTDGEGPVWTLWWEGWGNFRQLFVSPDCEFAL